MKCGKVVVGALILGIIAAVPSFITPTSASPDAPLSVYASEWVNATIESDGFNVNCGDWNVTGNITIYNSNAFGERVFDIWVPLTFNVDDYDYVDASGAPLANYTWVAEKPAYARVVTEAPPSWVTNTYPDGYPSPTVWVHITELQNGDRVVLKYIAKPKTAGCPPIQLSETMIPLKIVDGQQQTIKVNLTVTNNLPFDISVRIRKILPADNTAGDGWANTPNNPIFTSNGTSATAGKSGLSPDGKQLNWSATGDWPDGWFIVLAGGSATLENFEVTGTPDLSEVGGETTKVTLGTVYLRFKFAHTLTGMQVGYVYSAGQADVEVKKEQGTSATNTWNETAVIYDTSGVFDYEIVYARVWATETNNPEDTPIAGSDNSPTWAGTPFATIGPGEAETSWSYGPFNFTYTGVPKVWGTFRFRIQKDETYGWWNYTNTTAGEEGGFSKFILREMIWVVRGYLVKARKEIRPGPVDNMTCVTVELYNIGEWMAPYVELYDLIPKNFVVLEDSPGNESMMFFPLSMLAQDADAANSPPDYSLVVTGLTDYEKGYVWKTYPIPAPQRGFAEWFDGTGLANQKTVEVVIADGSMRSWTVYPVDASTVNINGTNYAEGTTLAAGGTTFLVSWVQDTLATGGGKVVVSAQGTYENLNMEVYNPIVVHYCVIGEGDYNLTDIFIVGVDPRHTLDAISVFTPNANVGLGSATYEQWLVAIVVLLVTADIVVAWRRASKRKETS